MSCSERSVWINGELVPEGEARISIFEVGMEDGILQAVPGRKTLSQVPVSMRAIQIQPGLRNHGQMENGQIWDITETACMLQKTEIRQILISMAM